MPSRALAGWHHRPRREPPLARPVGSEGRPQAGRRRRGSALHSHLVSYWESGGCRQPDRPSPEDPSHAGAERTC